MQPPIYTFDESRLAELARYEILDTPAEEGFDDIVELAAQICETPVALVSLVAADRQWFKARIGFEPCETDLDSSVCAHALVEDDLLVIPDLTQDERTHKNPLVTKAPHIRFYAGAPFKSSSGEVLGSLCVIDGKVRPQGLTHNQAKALRNLARQVTSQMELRRALAERDKLVLRQRQAEAIRGALLRLGDHLRDATASTDMTITASRIIGQTLNVTRAGFGRLDEGGHHVTVEPDWTADGVGTIAGHYRLNNYKTLWDELRRGDTVVIKDVRIDYRTDFNPTVLLGLDVLSMVYVPVKERGRVVAVLIIHDNKTRQWSADDIGMLQSVADRLEAGLGRLQAMAAQDVLNHELSHRLKNTFAMIQAIAIQTLKSVPDQAPVEAFYQRLHTLSTAHDVLLKQMWTTANLSEVVHSVIGTLIDTSRLDISGPEFEIGSRATVSVSLILHELTTNAFKYGAFSNSNGRVSLAWDLETRDGVEELVLEWREGGGPLVDKPVQKGFGSKLIRLGLTGSGGADIRYLPSGLHAFFRAPVAQVQLP
ncbi:GAF domain-containing protein [Acidisoma silvae]|uniref:histidine kinase n=1 Tax=Acidisoma silvae TaxID=2802396 RepID=A0A964E1N7_9PROT|nr:GAF domain-containing protein [Acidisoma silvae]MCB8877968.1 GAF domain-containing protein [Acidisoma silvae]